MSHFYKHIIIIFFLAVAGFYAPSNTYAQEADSMDKLEMEVKSILEKYVYLSGQIRPNVEPDPGRPFNELFRVARTPVFDDLNSTPGTDLIPVREYSEKVKVLFPGGLTTRIDYNSIKIGNIPDVSDDRIMVEVKLRKTVSGTKNGQEYRHSQKVIFTIGFNLEEGQYRNFLIHGISPIAEHDHDLILSLSPFYNRIFNSELMSDTRFAIPWEISWGTGIQYQYMFNSSWGAGTGIRGLISKHSLSLDKFDPLDGHEPNMKDVRWSGQLYYFELPLYAVYQKAVSKRLSIEINGGVQTAYRIFEEVQTSAVNFHSGEELTGVVSEPTLYESISDIDFGLNVQMGLKIDLSKRLAFLVQAGFKQGILPVQKSNEHISAYNLYQGQFNPLFNSDKSSVNQAFTTSFALSYRLFGRSYLD